MAINKIHRVNTALCEGDMSFSLFIPSASPFCLAHVTAKVQLHTMNECAATLRRKGNVVPGSCLGTFWKPGDYRQLGCYRSHKPEAIHCHFLLPRGVSSRHVFSRVSSFPWNAVDCRVQKVRLSPVPLRLLGARSDWKSRGSGEKALETRDQSASNQRKVWAKGMWTELGAGIWASGACCHWPPRERILVPLSLTHYGVIHSPKMYFITYMLKCARRIIFWAGIPENIRLLRNSLRNLCL